MPFLKKPSPLSSGKSSLASDSMSASEDVVEPQSNNILSQFRNNPFCMKPTDLMIEVSAPGKVILHGEHSVLFGKLAIAGSLGLRTRIQLVEFHPNEDSNYDTISINLDALNLSHCYKLNDIQEYLLDQPLPLNKNASNFNFEKPELLNHDALLKHVESFVEKHSGTFPLNYIQKLSLSALFYLFYGILGSLNIAIHPISLTIGTDLTISAGTGSSASYLVAVTATFYQYIRLKTSSKSPCDISKNGYKSFKLQFEDLKQFSKKELDLISRWAYCAERIIHGSASGVDNTICTYGSLVEFRKSTGAKAVELPNKFKILLVNTKVPRQTKALATKVATLRNNHPSIVDTVLDAMNEVAEKALESLSFVSKECAAVMDNNNIKEKLKEHYDKLGELASMNHNLLRTLQVSHSTLDLICSILGDFGLHGKLTGAGGGGYAIALIPPYLEQTTIDTVIGRLEKEGFDAVVTDLGGPGVTIHSSSS